MDRYVSVRILHMHQGPGSKS
ncbi:protein of unknown function (plasmid) [Caballeronia sp. S22]